MQACKGSQAAAAPLPLPPGHAATTTTQFRCALLSSSSKAQGLGTAALEKAPLTKTIYLKLGGRGRSPAAQLGTSAGSGGTGDVQGKRKGENCR